MVLNTITDLKTKYIHSPTEHEKVAEPNNKNMPVTTHELMVMQHDPDFQFLFFLLL